MSEAKRCSKCGEIKPLSEFHKHPSGKDGLRPRCKACRKIDTAVFRAKHLEESRARENAYNADHKDERRVYKAAYYLEHADEIKKKHHQYYLEHRKYFSRRNSEYRQTHADEQRVYKREYYQMNADSIARQHKAYSLTKRGRAAKLASFHNYRARGGGKVSASEIMRARAEYGGLCPYCNQPITKGHVDHVVPLFSGGTSERENLVWCCASCNRSKSNKSLLEFMMYRRLVTR